MTLEERVAALEEWGTRLGIAHSSLAFLVEVMAANWLAPLTKADADAVLTEIANPYRLGWSADPDMSAEQLAQMNDAAFQHLEELLRKVQTRADEIRDARAAEAGGKV
jgi:hypothetical protein